MPKLVTLYPFKKLPFLASRDMSRPWTIKSGIWTWVTWCNMLYTYLTTVAARLTLWLYKTNVHLFNYCTHLEWILWHQTSILCLRMLNFSSKNLPPCIFQTWRHSSWEKPFTTWMQCYIHCIAVDNSIFSITTVVKWQWGIQTEMVIVCYPISCVGFNIYGICKHTSLAWGYLHVFFSADHKMLMSSMLHYAFCWLWSNKEDQEL